MNKIVLLLVIACVCCWTNAQTISHGLMGSMVVNTQGGNRLELSYSTENGTSFVRICDWYRTLGESGIHFSSLGNSILTFKSELRNLQTKYDQWVATAKSNKVQDVEKEMPCVISYATFSCDAFAGNATKVVVKPYFVVRNYVPLCEIRIWQYFYDRAPNYNVWHLTPKDIPFLISAIDKGYKEYISSSIKKKKTEDLFN